MRCLLLLMLVLMVVACQPSDQGVVIPTLAELATQEVVVPADTVAPTLTPAESPTLEATATETLELSSTPLPSETPVATIPAPVVVTQPLPALSTGDIDASATSAILEAPRFSTVTPVPLGETALPTTIPVIVADLVITEPQFQEEVDLQIQSIESIEAARVNFTPDGIDVVLTASGGQASITGNVLIGVEVSNGLVLISIASIMTNAPEPPAGYLDVVSNEFYPMMINVLDTILNQRLGDQQDMENIVLTSSQMLVTLLVPISVATPSS